MSKPQSRHNACPVSVCSVRTCFGFSISIRICLVSGQTRNTTIAVNTARVKGGSGSHCQQTRLVLQRLLLLHHTVSTLPTQHLSNIILIKHFLRRPCFHNKLLCTYIFSLACYLAWVYTTLLVLGSYILVRGRYSRLYLISDCYEFSYALLGLRLKGNCCIKGGWSALNASHELVLGTIRVAF